MPNLNAGNITVSVVTHKLDNSLKRYRTGAKGTPNAAGIRITEPCNIKPRFLVCGIDLNELFPIEHPITPYSRICGTCI